MPRKRPEPHDAPPGHLREHGLRLWARVRADFSIGDAAGLHLLSLACEGADRAADARTAMADGPTYLDRFNQPRPHPATTILRDATGQQIMALRALGVTGSPED